MTAAPQTFTSGLLMKRIADAKERLAALQADLTLALRDSAKAEMEGRFPGCAVRDLRAQISGFTDELAGLNAVAQEAELGEIESEIEILEAQLEPLWAKANDAKRELNARSRTQNEFGSSEHFVADARARWSTAEDRYQSEYGRLQALKVRREELLGARNIAQVA